MRKSAKRYVIATVLAFAAIGAFAETAMAAAKK